MAKIQAWHGATVKNYNATWTSLSTSEKANAGSPSSVNPGLLQGLVTICLSLTIMYVKHEL